MDRWLVTGASGQLGGHLLAALHRRADVEVLAPGRPLAPEMLLHAVDVWRPTHVVHLAAVSSPAAVAADPVAARRVNVDLAVALAEHAAATGAWMLFPSSDWVYGGDADGLRGETDDCRPGSTYGRMKLEAEQRLRATAPVAVARFALMCGLPRDPERRTTWTTARERLLAGETVRAIHDELRTPLALAAAADAVLGLADAGYRGTVNVAGPRVLRPSDVFGALAASVGAGHLVTAVLRRDLAGCADRPWNVAMSSERLRTALGGTPPPISPETFSPAVVALPSPRAVVVTTARRATATATATATA